MLTLEGTYKEGRVELREKPPEIAEARVLVTFLESKEIDLRGRGIGESQAADLRQRLSTFADDWNRPDMDVYDED